MLLEGDSELALGKLWAVVGGDGFGAAPAGLIVVRSVALSRRHERGSERMKGGDISGILEL